MQDKYVLPLVDISLLNSTNLDDRMQVAQALDQACKEVGFLYLKGDQFQPALFAQLCDIAKHYFAQDDALKMQNYIGKSVNHSGYVPIGEEQFSSNSYDLKESYDVNYDYQGSALNYPLLGPTQWPDDPAFKRHVSQYYQHLKAIGHQLFRCFALALEQKEDFLMCIFNMHPASYASFTIHITLKRQMQKASGRIPTMSALLYYCRQHPVYKSSLSKVSGLIFLCLKIPW